MIGIDLKSPIDFGHKTFTDQKQFQLPPSLLSKSRQSCWFAMRSNDTQPRESPFDHPSPRQNHKSLHTVTSFDNQQNPMTKIRYPINELAGIAAIGPDQRQTTEPTSQFTQNKFRAIAILNISGMNHHGHHQTQRIYHQMVFSTRYLLSRVVAFIPPFEAVLTDWLSIIAALGQGSLPTWIRTCSWRAS